MQLWACMAVRSISYRKGPLRRAALTQFGISSASPQAGGAEGTWAGCTCMGCYVRLMRARGAAGPGAADPLQAISYPRTVLWANSADPPPLNAQTNRHVC